MKKSQKILYIVSLVATFFFAAGLVATLSDGSIELMMRQYFKISMRYGESYFTQLFLIRGILIFLLSLPFALLIRAILRSVDNEDLLRNKLPKVSFIFGILSFAFVWGIITQLASLSLTSPLSIMKVVVVIMLPPLFLFVIPGALRKKSFKSILLRSLGVIIVLLGVISIFGNLDQEHMGAHNDGIPLPDLNISPIYIADFAQDDILMGASHNVFIGRVLNQSGTKALGSSPETQFQVEVIDNIKGDLKGTVTVNQFGGYQNGTLVTVEDETNGTNEPYLLEPGQTYLFATRYLEGENWYTVLSSSYGKKLLSKDENASIAQLKTLALNDERVKALTAAYPNEKLLDADVQHQNTRNNYKDHEAKLKAERERANTTQANPSPEIVPATPDTPPDVPPRN